MADADNSTNDTTATAPGPTTSTAAQTVVTAVSSVTLPRVTIKFCTQCKWNLRAAYYAQELLQTFSTTLGEVALIPDTGGTFEIRIFYATSKTAPTAPTCPTTGPSVPTENYDGNDGDGSVNVTEKVLWDRKVDGGFPETKELKGRVRDVIEPGRGLGHTDRALARDRVKKEETGEAEKDQRTEIKQQIEGGPDLNACKDCS